MNTEQDRNGSEQGGNFLIAGTRSSTREVGKLLVETVVLYAGMDAGRAGEPVVPIAPAKAGTHRPLLFADQRSAEAVLKALADDLASGHEVYELHTERAPGPHTPAPEAVRAAGERILELVKEVEEEPERYLDGGELIPPEGLETIREIAEQLAAREDTAAENAGNEDRGEAPAERDADGNRTDGILPGGWKLVEKYPRGKVRAGPKTPGWYAVRPANGRAGVRLEVGCALGPDEEPFLIGEVVDTPEGNRNGGVLDTGRAFRPRLAGEATGETMKDRGPCSMPEAYRRLRAACYGGCLPDIRTDRWKHERARAAEVVAMITGAADVNAAEAEPADGPARNGG